MFPPMDFPLSLRAGPRLRRRLAFSLVEVAIALGISSFAIVTIMGMIPVGLSTMREARDYTVEAQIKRRISSEAAMYPFDRLADYANGSDLLFTQDGTQQTGSGTDALTRYAVSIKETNVAYPGSSLVAGRMSANLAALAIEIRRVAGATVLSRSTNVVFIPYSGSTSE